MGDIFPGKLAVSWTENGAAGPPTSTQTTDGGFTYCGTTLASHFSL